MDLESIPGRPSVGYFPLFREATALYGTRLSNLGSGKACSDYTGPICRPGHEEDVCDAFVRYLYQSEFSMLWDVLELDGLCGAMPNTQPLRNAFLRFADGFGEECRQSTWQLSVKGGWDEYLASHSKRTRRLTKRSVTDFFDSGRAKLVFAEKRQDLAWQMHQIEQMHQSHWQAKGIEGCFSTSGFREFCDRVFFAFIGRNLERRASCI